jgi:predicted ABC-type ATPase
VLILAGPNGAGKTTASRLLVPDGMVFVNADVVARRLTEAGHPPAGLDIAAGRVVLAEMRQLADQRVSFCTETNLAGRGMLRSIERWRDGGYRVRLAFLALENPNLALTRVAHRVAKGGHSVADDVVRRRWKQGLSAFFSTYMDEVDSWTFIDNSRDHAVTVARSGSGSDVMIADRELWDFYRALI